MDEPRDAAALAEVVAAALDLGRGIDRWSLALTLLALAFLVPAAAGTWPAGRLVVGGFVAAVAAGVAQRGLAARTAFDAAAFARWSAVFPGQANDVAVVLAAFDGALAASGLRPPPSGATRQLADRARGALRLLRWQAAALTTQIAGLLLPAVAVLGG